MANAAVSMVKKKKKHADFVTAEAKVLMSTIFTFLWVIFTR